MNIFQRTGAAVVVGGVKADYDPNSHSQQFKLQQHHPQRRIVDDSNKITGKKEKNQSGKICLRVASFNVMISLTIRAHGLSLEAFFALLLDKEYFQ